MIYLLLLLFVVIVIIFVVKPRGYRLLIPPVLFATVGPAFAYCTVRVIMLDERIIFPDMLFFVFIGAYIVGIIPAAVAGFIYSAMRQIYMSATTTDRTSYLLGIAFGIAGGIVSMAAFNIFAINQLRPNSNGIAELDALGIASSTLCAAFHLLLIHPRE